MGGMNGGAHKEIRNRRAEWACRYRERSTIAQKNYLLAPILNIFVPQCEQVPEVAGFPFFMVTAVGSFISFFALHLTQYASITLPSSGHRRRLGFGAPG